MANLSVEIKRTNQKVHFEAVSIDNPDISVPFDFTPPIGDGEGFAGLELLLMSFCGCVSTTVIFLLNRAGKHVKSYSAHAEGIRNERPISLAEINFHIFVESDDISPDDLAAAVKQAEAISPVMVSIRNNVRVNITYDLNR